MTKKGIQNCAIVFFLILALLSPFAVFWINERYFTEPSEKKTEVRRNHDIRFHYSEAADRCFIITYNTFKFKNDVPVGIEKIECTDKVKEAARENKSLLN